MSLVKTEYEIVFTPQAVAELLREGATHKIIDGLPFEYGEEPHLADAIIGFDGKLRLIFIKDGAVPTAGDPAITIVKPITITTLEELG